MKPMPGRFGRSTVALACCLGFLAPPSSNGQNLQAIPQPNLDAVESRIREQLSAARQTAASILETDPPLPAAARADAVGTLGRLYLLYGFFEAAEPCFAQASDTRPGDPRWHYFLGILHQQERRLDAADLALVKVTELRPEDVPTRVRRAQIALAQSRLDDAETLFRALLSADDNLAIAHHGLARIAESRRDWRAAAAGYERVLALQPKADAVHYSVGLAYRQLGNLDRARSHLAARGTGGVIFDDPLVEALNHENAGSAPLVVAGNHAMAAGDLEASVAFYRAALERAPDDHRTQLSLAQAFTRLGLADQAVALYRQVLDARPDEEPVAHFNLGTLLLEKGEPAAAVAAFRRALTLAPDFTHAMVNLAGALERMGDLDAARDQAMRAVLQAPEDEEAMLLLARLDAQRGDAASARARVSAWIERHPNSAAALLAAGSLGTAMDDVEAAREAFERVLMLEASDGQQADAHLGMASLDRTGALGHLERAAGLAPERADIRQTLAAAYGRAGRLVEAAMQYGEAIALAPQEPGSHFGKATALILAGNHGRAKTTLEDAVSILPQSIPLRHALARLLATSAEETVRDGTRALSLAEQIFREQPSIDHAETMAMALAELGRFEEAAAIEQRVIDRATASGRGDRVNALRERLEQYRRGEPVRDRRGM